MGADGKEMPMNPEVMMSLEGLITISLVIAVVGTTLTHLFRNAESPYLITVTGSRLSLVVYGLLTTAIALGVGVVVLLAVSAVTAPIIALALFFGIEAVALDICFHRTRYIRVTSSVSTYERVRVTLPISR
jgi:hypothetical protein